MKPLSPLDAISPAFKRTNEVLLRPFLWRRSWKLAATSYLGAAGSVFIPFPLVFLLVPMFVPASGREATNILYGAALVTMVVYLALFYVAVRMELVAFEMVVTRAKVIGPLWTNCGPRTWQWFGLSVGVGTLATLLMAPFGISAGRSLVASLQSLTADAGAHVVPSDIFGFYRVIFGFYGIIAIVFLVPKFVSVLFNDFVLPFYLIERLTLAEATARGFRLIAQNVGSTLLYLICKVILFFVGAMAQNLVTQLLMLPFVIVFVLCALVLGLGHGSLESRGLLAVAALFVLVVLFVFVLFYVVIGATGYLMTVLESYAAFFVGSRFAGLGDLLEPPPPPVYTYAPPPMPTRPDEDDEDGPSFPMDPALV
jgi:hypothetical protein